MDPAGVISDPNFYTVLKDFSPAMLFAVFAFLLLFKAIPKWLENTDKKDERRMLLVETMAEKFITPFLESQQKSAAALEKLSNEFSIHIKTEESNRQNIDTLQRSVGAMASEIRTSFQQLKNEIRSR